MRYLALATDYDGTLAADGVAEEPTLDALRRLIASGRKLILVTGRRLDDLQRVFPHLDLFHRVVVENGAVLYRPETNEVQDLCSPPEASFVEELTRRGVTPVDVGRVIVATWHPHESTVLEVIREQGLGLQVIFNKGAVMVLPTGVTKATGMVAALGELRLSAHNTVGIGDAENDHAFLEQAGCSVAVANALPAVKQTADFVTNRSRGQGVVELVERILDDESRLVPERQMRRAVVLARADGRDLLLPPSGKNILVAGPSGSGKSTFVTGLLERVRMLGYQFCVVDPEGDYEALEGALTLGKPDRAPARDEIASLLEDPNGNAVVNLLGVDIADRPSFLRDLLPRLDELRAETGRPHWLVLDEVHHMLQEGWEPQQLHVRDHVGGTVLVTVHPERLARGVLAAIDFVAAIGEPAAAFDPVARALRLSVPRHERGPAASGKAMLWHRADDRVESVDIVPARTARLRHKRKYAAGDLGEDRSFYFTGPDGKMRLQAQNLQLFAQIARGVDDATWLHHLQRGDYSQWFRECIKDDDLAALAARVEREGGDADPTRRRILDAIENRYTAPA